MGEIKKSTTNKIKYFKDNAIATHKQGKLEEAIDNYEKVIELGANEDWIYIKLGDAYGELGKNDLALKIIEKGIALNSQNIWGYIAAANILHKQGRVEEALEQCEAGLRVNPGQEKLEFLKTEIRKSFPVKSLNDKVDNTLILRKEVASNKIEHNSKYKANSLEGVNQELALQKAQLEKLTFQVETINQKLKLLDYPLKETFSVQNLSQRIVIDGGFPLTSEQGFYSSEYDSHGNQYRWTGPKKSFYFDLLIDRSNTKRICLRLIDPATSENVKTLRCFVDDQEIELQKSEYVNGVHKLIGILPKREGKGKTKISFWVKDLVKNSELNPNSQDHRLLGVTFSSLTIEPGESAS